MSKRLFYKLLSLGMTLGNYSDELFYDDLVNDEKVNDCLLMVYFSMMTEDKVQCDKFYNEFENKYNELNDDQKEMVKIEIAKILNIEYEPKIKKKEKRRDE